MSFCTRDGEVLQDDPTSIVGTTLDGQYTVEAMLGKGGMGAVYCARHILLGDRVAIKVLPPQMRNNAEWLRRFQREGQAARRFRHPNAVTVYDLRSTSDGLTYMVMEYVEGRTLDQELRSRGHFTPYDALSVLDPVMNALNAAHALGVVHRDIKPENIMIGRAQTGTETTVKILDLGIAKLAAGDEVTGTDALTVAGQILGTPHYMSPEQWGEIPRDGGHEIDGRADIYSLGAVIYQLISGKRPFSGITLPEVRREHVSITPLPLSEAVENVPEPFSVAVMRALSKDRNDRQATAGEFANELRAALGLSPAESLSPFQPILAETKSQQTPTANQNEGQTNMNVSSHRTNAPTEVLRGNTGINAGAIQSETMADMVHHQQHQQTPQPQTPVNSPIEQPLNYKTTPQHTEGLEQSHSQQNSDFSTQQPHSHSLPPTSMANFSPPHGVNVSPTSPVNVAPVSQPASKPKKSSSKALLLIPVFGIGALIVLIAVGVGGYVFWDKIFPTSDPDPNPTSSPSVSNSPNETKPPEINLGGKEQIRYWFDVLKSQNGDSERLAEEPTILKSGQSFKFSFIPQEDGYLYVIGSGRNDALTTFLTENPVKESGVNTNKLIKGERFIFPLGDKNWFVLDENIGLETYTSIFSPTKILTPTFLTLEAGRLLNDEEKKELKEFLEKYKANKAQLNVKAADTKEPFVSVNASIIDEPIIFIITVDHR